MCLVSGARGRCLLPTTKHPLVSDSLVGEMNMAPSSSLLSANCSHPTGHEGQRALVLAWWRGQLGRARKVEDWFAANGVLTMEAAAECETE